MMINLFIVISFMGGFCPNTVRAKSTVNQKLTDNYVTELLKQSTT